jgi:hypothetical protein
MFRNWRKPFLGFFQVAATVAARESGMELDTRVDNFQHPPTEMEEEPMRSPHVEATCNRTEVDI